MTVDVPYPDIQNPEDYFSMTVVKFKGEKRPRVISFAASSTINTKKGMTIYFAGYKENKTIKMSDVKYEHIPFTKVDPEYVKLSADSMYLDPEKTKDLLEPMLSNNYMIFVFFDKNDRMYQVSYPLLWFKEKMELLK